MDVNGKLDLYWNDEIFKTDVQDVTEEYIVIGIPMHNGSYLALAKGDLIELVYYDDLSLYGFTSEVIGRSREGMVHQIFIKHPESWRKIQRRNFVRVGIIQYINYEVLKDGDYSEKKNGIIIDLSGGGLRLKTAEKLGQGDIIRVFIKNEEVNIVGNGKIVRIEKDTDGRFLYGVSFEEIDGLSRERVIQYVFNIMRKQRKLALKEE